MPADDPLSTSTSLLNAVSAGNQSAWCRLVDAYTPLIVHWCRQRGIQGCDADDIVQNTFIAVAQHIGTFGHDRVDNTFRGWLWTIARSKIIDELRRTRQHPNPADGQKLNDLAAATPRDMDEPGYTESAGDYKLLIRSALNTIRRDFSPQTWEAFWMTSALSQRPSEVAKQLGLTPSAVCMARARVLRRLRETLGED